VGAGAVLVIGLVTMIRWPLAAAEGLNLEPAGQWPDPNVLVEPEHEQGPVLVTIEYRVAPEQLGELASAMQPLGRIRRRDGAMRWSPFFDPADPRRCRETFVVESWVELLRQHERMTVSDQTVQERVRAFHIGDDPPVVSHLVYLSPTSVPDLASVSPGSGVEDRRPDPADDQLLNIRSAP
jgi:hypothetical protein